MFVRLAAPWVALWFSLAALATACTPTVPEGRFACDLDEDCPPDQRCDLDINRCHTPDGG